VCPLKVATANEFSDPLRALSIRKSAYLFLSDGFMELTVVFVLRDKDIRTQLLRPACEKFLDTKGKSSYLGQLVFTSQLAVQFRSNGNGDVTGSGKLLTFRSPLFGDGSLQGP
jgi:hypothetical protein